MINNPKETTEFPPREEGNSSDQIGKVSSTTTKVSSSCTLTNPTPWIRLKDPRIVRVSRAFGGKDRHSKVCTIRGLRDRRVRLSVPTAIQLYDLQDRLGLNQPSKVVDWLLNAAKDEIDELPPLPMPLAGNLSLLTSSSREANTTGTTTANQNGDQGVVPKHNIKNDMSGIDWELGSSSTLPARPNFWTNSSATTITANISSDALWRARSKEVLAREIANSERENWGGNNSSTRNIDLDHQKEEGNQLPQRRKNNHPLFSNMINNIAHMPNGTANYRWEPAPNCPLLSQSGGSSHGPTMITSQTDHDDQQQQQQHLQSLDFMSLQSSTLSLSTGSSPFLLCPPGNTSTRTATQTYFPSQAASSMEIVDPRQGNHFQMLMSLPNPMRSPPFHFGTSNPKLVGYYSLNDNIIGSDHQQNKEQD